MLLSPSCLGERGLSLVLCSCGFSLEGLSLEYMHIKQLDIYFKHDKLSIHDGMLLQSLCERVGGRAFEAERRNALRKKVAACMHRGDAALCSLQPDCTQNEVVCRVLSPPKCIIRRPVVVDYRVALCVAAHVIFLRRGNAR